MSINGEFKPWPSLAPYGKTLKMPGGELFYYDSEGIADPEGNTDSEGDGGSYRAGGKPTVVLVHGLGDEADTWRHVFHRLAEAGCRVIAPDLPGFGRSQWRGRINVHNHAMVIIRLMIETGAASAEKPVVFAGNSLGTGIAELVACKRPDLIKALILIDGCFPFSGSMRKNFFIMGLPFIGKRWYRGFRHNHEGAWMSLYPYYNDLDSMNAEDKAFLRQRVIARVESPNQERGYFATLRSMYAFIFFNIRSITRKIKTFPGYIALIWGEKDIIFPQEKSGAFRQMRPDVDFTIISGAGHLPQQEKPNEIAAKMLQIITGGII